MEDTSQFLTNIGSAGPAFLIPFPGGTILTVGGFVFGFAAAAIGFGLGQPQIVSRYLAGSSPQETQSAWWIYIGFVQFTWIAMTAFGMVLRGVMPRIAHPETGLSVFFHQNIGAVPTGIIAGDVFATIAATSNGILIAMAQAAKYDLLPGIVHVRSSRISLPVTTMIIGGITIVTTMLMHGAVVTVVLSSVSMMGAGLAGAVMIKVLRWPHTSVSLLATIIAGLLAGASWRYSGMTSLVNEAGVGITAGLLANWVFMLSKNAMLHARYLELYTDLQARDDLERDFLSGKIEQIQIYICGRLEKCWPSRRLHI